MPASKEEIMAQIEELEGVPKQSQIHIEHREQLLKCICQLMQLDLAFALQTQLPQVLWSSQKGLFNGVREHYLTVIKQPASSREDSRTAIARLNCVNVLHTLYSEWFQLALLVEAAQSSSCRLLPLDGDQETRGVSEHLLGLEDTHPVKKFAEVLYTRLGDINRYMNDFKLSKKFYNAVLQLDPSNGYSLTQLDRLDKLAGGEDKTT